MKYYVTDKKLEQLKTVLEGFVNAPKDIANAINEEIVTEGGEAIEGLDIGLSEVYAELLREFKFLIEDIEGQDLRELPKNRLCEIAHDILGEVEDECERCGGYKDEEKGCKSGTDYGNCCYGNAGLELREILRELEEPKSYC